MNMTIYEFMNLCQSSKSFMNVSVYKWSYISPVSETNPASMRAIEVFDGVYSEMPIALRYEVVKKWDIEMRNYKPYIVLYI